MRCELRRYISRPLPVLVFWKRRRRCCIAVSSVLICSIPSTLNLTPCPVRRSDWVADRVPRITGTRDLTPDPLNQVVSLRLLTSGIRVQVMACACGTRRRVFLLVLRFFSLSVHPQMLHNSTSSTCCSCKKGKWTNPGNLVIKVLVWKFG